MVTTIQISEELLRALKLRKLHTKESYEQVIWDLIEDQLTLKDEVLQRMSQGIDEYEKGEYIEFDEVFED